MNYTECSKENAINATNNPHRAPQSAAPTKATGLTAGAGGRCRAANTRRAWFNARASSLVGVAFAGAVIGSPPNRQSMPQARGIWPRRTVADRLHDPTTALARKAILVPTAIEARQWFRSEAFRLPETSSIWWCKLCICMRNARPPWPF